MTLQAHLRPDPAWSIAIGVGGIGSGLSFALEGNEPLGRNESRPARLLDVRDYCKLHIVAHHVAVLMGADVSGEHFLVRPIGSVGDDAAGLRLIEEMARAGMDIRHVATISGVPTLLSICFQYPDGSGGNITTSVSAAAALTLQELDRAVDALPEDGKRVIAIALPEVPLALRRHLLERATPLRALRVAAFTSTEIGEARDDGTLGLVDLLSMNEDEAQALTGAALDPLAPGPFLEACRGALGDFSGKRIIVTAGQAGAFAVEAHSWDFCPAAAVAAVNTAGAGDALLGGVIAGLAAGLPFVEQATLRPRMTDRPLASAFDLGCLAAAYSITSKHTIHPEFSLGNLMRFANELGILLAPSILDVVAAESGNEKTGRNTDQHH
jgi:sugar/nucleoside kinase (ribokinase family)